MKKLFIAIALIFTAFTCCLFAEELLDEKYGYYLDLPEGFQLDSSSDDGLSFLFTHPSMPVELILRIYEGEMSTHDALSTVLTKLGAQFETDDFKWGTKDCAASTFKMNLGMDFEGLSFASPINDGNATLVILGYCPSVNFTKASQFIMSMLNSLVVDSETENLPGILVSYAYPNEEKTPLTLNIGGKQIKTKIDKVDEEANQFVVDMEFGCFTFYAKHKLWKEAWQRYYKMVYRDSKARLRSVSKDIYKGLGIKNRTDYANTLLQWTQNFPYKRDNTKNTSSDFTNLISTLKGEGNDCDSRSMLVSALLNIAGMDSVMLISRDYSHAMTSIVLDAPGQTFKYNGKDYLYGETTVPVTFGMVAQNQSDFKKWIVVDLK